MRAYAGWMEQAIRDLQVAKETMEKIGAYEWVCFQAQQAAEKAVKAVLEALGEYSRGHLIKELMARIEGKMNVNLSDLMECAEFLDLQYTPTRYPNIHAGVAPTRIYGPSTARRALSCSERIVEEMKSLLERLGRR